MPYRLDFIVFLSGVLDLFWQAANYSSVSVILLSVGLWLRYGGASVVPLQGQVTQLLRCGHSWISTECPEYSWNSSHYGHWGHQCLPHCGTSGISVQDTVPQHLFSPRPWHFNLRTCSLICSQTQVVPVQISGFLLYAAPSSLVPCPANFSSLVSPYFWSAFLPALVWVLLPRAVVWKAPGQKASSNVDFTSSVFLLSKFPSLQYL